MDVEDNYNKFTNGYGKATFEKWKELEEYDIGQIIYSFDDMAGCVVAYFKYFDKKLAVDVNKRFNIDK